MASSAREPSGHWLRSFDRCLSEAEQLHQFQLRTPRDDPAAPDPDPLPARAGEVRAERWSAVLLPARQVEDHLPVPAVDRPVRVDGQAGPVLVVDLRDDPHLLADRLGQGLRHPPLLGRDVGVPTADGGEEVAGDPVPEGLGGFLVGPHQQGVEACFADQDQEWISSAVQFLTCGNVVCLTFGQAYEAHIHSPRVAGIEVPRRAARAASVQHRAHVRRDEPRLPVDHHDADRLPRDREARPHQHHLFLLPLFVVHQDAPPSTG